GYYFNQLKALVKRNLLLNKASKPTLYGYLGRFGEKLKSNVEVENPTNLVLLNEYISFNTEKPVLGFVLPEGSDQSIIEKIMNNNIFNNTQIKAIQFKTEEEMVSYNTNLTNTEQIIGGVIFENKDLLKYTIRLDNENTENPETSPVKNIAESVSFFDIPNSYLTLFTPIQVAIDEAIISMKTQENIFTMKYFIGKLAFMMPVYIIALNIVKEKEDNIRDGLLIAGVHPTVLWLSCVIFSVIFIFALSACSLAFLFSTFFKKAKTAGVVVLIFYFISFLTAHFISLVNENIAKMASFLISSITLEQILKSFDNLKYTYKSLNFINIFKTDAGMYFVILIGNMIFYLILAIIIDNLLSSETGKYLFTPKRKMEEFHSDNEVSYQKDIQEDINYGNKNKCMVEVNHVHKIFKKYKKYRDREENCKTNPKLKPTEFFAVDDVSFKVYQNEIFAILGN
ncbi:hypothetical protein PIROE2DRAFT_13975, partial [Piromyces sp. E2]